MVREADPVRVVARRTPQSESAPLQATGDDDADSSIRTSDLGNGFGSLAVFVESSFTSAATDERLVCCRSAPPLMVSTGRVTCPLAGSTLAVAGFGTSKSQVVRALGR